MAITHLNPYLNFNGNARQAIALYERALGAKTETVQLFGEVEGTPPGAEHRDRVMHALLNIGSATFMISDTMPQDPAAVGNNVYVCLHFDDVNDMARRFDALAVGGKVTMPLQDTFWGARFGTLTDAFGISWMFNCMLKPA